MIKIVADTTCALPREQLKLLGIPVIPQIVIFGETSYRDDTELDTAAFLQKLKGSAQLPKTAAPPPPLYNPIFDAALENGDEVIVIAPSIKVSGTARSAEVAAREFPQLKVHVVDSHSIAANVGALVLIAANLARQGESAETILKQLNEWIPRQRTYFLVDTLEYLQKGGRIGGAKALLGELLQVKPILHLQDGQVEPFEQQRTKKRALRRLVEIVEEQCPQNASAYLSVLQADAVEEAEALAAGLRSRMNLDRVPVYEMPPAIVVHGGPGIMGVAFMTSAR